MKYNPEIHHRHSIRLKDYDYSQAGAYFVTLLSKKRGFLFGEIESRDMVLNEAGKVAQAVWDSLPERFPEIELDEFIVMPNHLHGIILINEMVGAIHELPLQKPSLQKPSLQKPFLQEQPPLQTRKARRLMLLPKIAGWFKMNSAKQINGLRKTPGLPVWQRNYYEHIIRSVESWEKIRHYVAENPMRWQFDRENPAGRPDKAEENFWKSAGVQPLPFDLSPADN